MFDCHVILCDSPVTRARAAHLESLGVTVEWFQVTVPARTRFTVTERVGRTLKRLVRREQANPRQRPWLDEIVERRRPNLVWFNFAGMGMPPFLEEVTATCRANAIPYWLVFQHAHEHFFLVNDEQTDRFATMVEGARRVLCVSRRNQAALERAMGRRLKNIWRAVNAVTGEFLEDAAAVSKMHPIRVEGTARLLNLARFDPTFKGQHVLLEALSDPRWENRDWRLTLQGWGDFTSLLHRLINFYGLPTDRVQLCKYTSNVLPIIVGSDLLVMPSLSEGTPFAMVEAMACGRPAVGTPVGGIPELIIEGETGWLARSTEVGDVADALERAWAARPQWPIYGAQAQASTAANYDQNRTVLDLIEALQQDIHNAHD